MIRKKDTSGTSAHAHNHSDHTYDRTYGYNDPELVTPPKRWTAGRWLALVLAIAFIAAIWLALDYKLLFGHDWISQTYDNEDWRTNEGNLHTFGAWDLEAHIWKTEYIIKYWPNFHWNPYWYLGMPLLKYYQLGYYALSWGVVALTGLSVARASLLMIIFAHLLATLLTFLVCYKVSRRIWVSALASTFLLSNTFISLRSYGWEPITVVFLFLYPLGLLLFLREPLRPFRFWLVLVLGLSYLAHPLIFFSLCMFMGLYLTAVALSARPNDPQAAHRHYIWQYFAMVFVALLIGAVQFFPQLTYQQVSSGAHMGVKYLPFYQVPPNIISLKDFFFDAGNLKGPGPIIMIAFLLLIVFAYLELRSRHRHTKYGRMVFDNHLVVGVTLTLLLMVLFYYIELYNIFPMNVLRSIQYHRIIPEFIITAAVLVAALSNIAYTNRHKIIYYSLLVSFVLASFIVVYNVQSQWQTTDDISHKPEFVYERFPGRFTVPYTDQSFTVRNSFTEQPQVYGYYEQGITNPYTDEMFSVSSGYHNAHLTVLYLKAANVGRIYVNTEEGERDRIITARLNGTLPYNHTQGERYAYFTVPLVNPSFAQAVDANDTAEVKKFEVGCRELFKEHYCGSALEEFVSTDPAEGAYLQKYVDMIEKPYGAYADYKMLDPDHYLIAVSNASADTQVVVKMTYDKDFTATVNGEKAPIETVGPYFMLIKPAKSGDYTIELTYHVSKIVIVGAIVSVLAIIGLAAFCIVRAYRPVRKPASWGFRRGDMR